jgi:hypothetical protein
MTTSDDRKLTIELIRVPDEPEVDSRTFQKELRRFAKELNDAGISYTQEVASSTPRGPNTVGFITYISLPEFKLLLTAIVGTGGVVTALTTIITTWIKAHAGRKVLVKIDGLEVEAHNSKEVERALQQVAEYREKTEQTRRPQS